MCAVALQGADLLCAPVNWPLLPRPDGERPTEQVRALAEAGMNIDLAESRIKRFNENNDVHGDRRTDLYRRAGLLD